MGVSNSSRKRHGSANGLPLLVVVSGPPAAGKTTVADAVARRLGLPLVAKDAFKEVLGESLGVTGADRDASQRLGIAAFDLLFHVVGELLRTRCDAVAEGNFRHADRFASLPSARLVNVHVTAEPETIRARLAERTDRHSVHYDAVVADAVARQVAEGVYSPLALGGTLLRVDTTSSTHVDYEELAARVRAAAEALA
jgi:predicted kinase